LPNQIEKFPKKIIDLKVFLEDELKKIKGVCKLYKADEVYLNLQCVCLLEKLIAFGLYKEHKELNNLITPLINMLDSSLDF